MMHLSPDASAYLENVWLWVADHDIDDPDWTNDNNVMVSTDTDILHIMSISVQTHIVLNGEFITDPLLCNTTDSKLYLRRPRNAR